MSASRFGAVALSFLFMPAAAMAQDEKLTPAKVFIDAAPSMKFLMLALIVAMAAAVVITVRKVMSGPHLNGGSAFLSSLRLGGPLIGLLGATYNAVLSFMAIANLKQDFPLAVYAPGFAEAFTLFFLGLLAGVIAVICHGIVEARIDRAVLRA